MPEKITFRLVVVVAAAAAAVEALRMWWCGGDGDDGDDGRNSGADRTIARARRGPSLGLASIVFFFVLSFLLCRRLDGQSSMRRRHERLLAVHGGSARFWQGCLKFGLDVARCLYLSLFFPPTTSNRMDRPLSSHTKQLIRIAKK